MWVEAVLFFLGLSILFYCLFAGADFGVGILELFADRRERGPQRDAMNSAMGPVWEANHVWLVLAVVILFNGFPMAYARLSVSFHIPLTLMLVGVILRGTAFTFRHYDAVHDKYQRYYSRVYVFSSFVTPFLLGVIAGGAMLGRVDPSAKSYGAAYVAPWCNFFCFSTGALVCSIFAFLAAVYMIFETDDASLRLIFVRRARKANLTVIALGAWLFAAAQIAGFGLFEKFFDDSLSVACMGAATLLLVPLWAGLNATSNAMVTRALAAAQIALMLCGWFALQYPTLIAVKGSVMGVDVASAASPDVTLKYLFYALAAGSLLILPALGYLFKIFKLSGGRRPGP